MLSPDSPPKRTVVGVFGLQCLCTVTANRKLRTANPTKVTLPPLRYILPATAASTGAGHCSSPGNRQSNLRAMTAHGSTEHSGGQGCAPYLAVSHRHRTCDRMHDRREVEGPALLQPCRTRISLLRRCIRVVSLLAFHEGGQSAARAASCMLVHPHSVPWALPHRL